MIIDTHSHMYKSEYEEAENIIKKCNEKNISIILNGVDKKSNIEVLELSKKYNNVYASIGYAYDIADSITKDDIDLLENQIKNNKVIAIGEIGLDYHYTKDNKKEMQNLFESQLLLAQKYNLPVIVHSRDAVNDVYETLKKYNLKGSIHCYSGSVEMAQKFINIGFLIGIDGPITFKNNRKQVDLVKQIDINYILIETDSPYLSPEPKRGEKNTPLNLIYIIDKISDILCMDREEIIKITTNNAKELFKI